MYSHGTPQDSAKRCAPNLSSVWFGAYFREVTHDDSLLPVRIASKAKCPESRPLDNSATVESLWTCRASELATSRRNSPRAAASDTSSRSFSVEVIDRVNDPECHRAAECGGTAEISLKGVSVPIYVPMH